MAAKSDNGNLRGERARWRVAAPTAVVVGILLLAGCGGSSSHKAATTTTSGASPAAISVLGAVKGSGPWVRHLTLKLGRGGLPSQFLVCAVLGQARAGAPCAARTEAGFPIRGTLRLEQHPAGPGLPEADAPGWGTVGSSDKPDLRIVLSDFVSGNKAQTVTYRVSLHDAAGKRLATSDDVLTVVWHH